MPPLNSLLPSLLLFFFLIFIYSHRKPEIMLVRNLASPILNSAGVNPDTENKKQQIFGFIGSPKSKKKKQLCNTVDDEHIPDAGKCNDDSKKLTNVNSILESPIWV